MPFYSHRHPLLALYRADRETLYDPLAQSMRALVEALLRAEGLWIHAVTARAKTVQSLADKLRRKGNKYRTLREITDLTGVRVITYLTRDVDTAVRVLRESFVVDEANSIDRRQPDRTSEFGYGSVHLVLSLPEQRLALPEYRDFSVIRFEVQVRTILQHAWAEIEHDAGYKATLPLDRNAKRKLYRVAALLEEADDSLDETFSHIAEDDVDDRPTETLLTGEVLADMLDRDAQVLRLERLLDDVSGISQFGPAHLRGQPLERLAAELSGLGLDTRKKITNSIKLNFESFRQFLPVLIGQDVDQGGWSRGASLSLYCEYLAASTMNDDSLVGYLVRYHAWEDSDFTRKHAQWLIDASRILRTQ